jgi:hypothetical protein
MAHCEFVSGRRLPHTCPPAPPLSSPIRGPTCTFGSPGSSSLGSWPLMIASMKGRLAGSLMERGSPSSTATGGAAVRRCWLWADSLGRASSMPRQASTHNPTCHSTRRDASAAHARGPTCEHAICVKHNLHHAPLGSLALLLRRRHFAACKHRCSTARPGLGSALPAAPANASDCKRRRMSQRTPSMPAHLPASWRRRGMRGSGRPPPHPPCPRRCPAPHPPPAPPQICLPRRPASARPDPCPWARHAQLGRCGGSRGCDVGRQPVPPARSRLRAGGPLPVTTHARGIPSQHRVPAHLLSPPT